MYIQYKPQRMSVLSWYRLIRLLNISLDWLKPVDAYTCLYHIKHTMEIYFVNSVPNKTAYGR